MPYKDPEKRRACARAGAARRMADPIAAAKRKAYVKEWLQKNPDKQASYSRKAYRKNPDYYREWASNNRDKVAAASKKWATENPERRMKIAKAWSDKNPGIFPYYLATARAKRLNRIPAWADAELMELVYAEAAHRKLTVDHVIPLQSKKVCGLHVYTNTQLLTRSQNARKFNKFEPGEY